MHLLQVLILIIKITPTPTLTPTLALVVQSKSTHSQKPKLSTIKHGWLLCSRLCTHPSFLQGQILWRLQKSFRWDETNVPYVYTYTCVKSSHIYIWACAKRCYIYLSISISLSLSLYIYIYIYICLKNTLKLVKDTGNNQITQHAQKVSVFRMLKMDTAWKKKNCPGWRGVKKHN